MEEKPILKIHSLTTQFISAKEKVSAVDGINLAIKKGEAVAVVGESGSGKSVTFLSILGLIPTPPGKIVAGEAFYNGNDIIGLPEKRLNCIRGIKISMIFQEPMSSLNPVYSIGNQIGEMLKVHKGLKGMENRDKVISLLKKVGIPEPEKRMDAYPHELSGGLRQRALIAMGISCDPEILIADEPTTALDVTVQAQILQLLKNLQQETGMTIIMITHDFGVVSSFADRVVVMYSGKILEEGETNNIISQPHHPYTKGLINSVLDLDFDRNQKLIGIPGIAGNTGGRREGCRFHSRCPDSKEHCREKEPLLFEADGSGRKVACWQFFKAHKQSYMES